MFPYRLFGVTLAAAVIAIGASYADAEEFSARLDGFHELGALPNVNLTANPQTATNPTGAILSDGTATLKLDLYKKAGMATWTLTYSNVGMTPPLTGTVTQAHIHFGKSRDSGGVMVFFCTNLTPPVGPPTPQACPSNSGSVRGTFTKADVVAIGGQNVQAGDFNALVDALESNTAYANIHTTALGAGEIRGQIHKGDLDDEHERHDDHDHHDHR
jgi:CHRD domain